MLDRTAHRRSVACWAVFFFCLAGARAAPAAADPGDEYLAALVARSRALRLADTRLWEVLLHYRPTLFGGRRSEADGLGFFNAGGAGKTDPQRELEATLAAFRSAAVTPDPKKPPEQNQHPQCRFPARWTFLKSALTIDAAQFPDQPCPLFATWRQAFSAEKVTLVYASAYVNSPASMYGHTFLRLTRSSGDGNPLLDYIINFAADSDTENGFVYAVKGLTGGFRGYFYTMPYYVKIQEYSNIESRDLWEYELSLSREQTERLVQHTWETRSTHFDYFFAGENCSYFLLELLEAANPDLRLSDQFRGATIPANTVRAVLAVPGLVTGKARVRPSLRATMLARKRGMTGQEVRAAEALVVEGGSAAAAHLSPLPNDRKAIVLDAAYDRLRYKEGFHWPPSENFERKERDILILRGRTGLPPQEVSAVSYVDAPETGHRTMRLGAAGGVYKKGTGLFQELSLRFAIHDYLDAPRGYPEDALLEMGLLRLRIDDRNRHVFIERANALHIVSAAPVDRWFIKPSWKIWAGGAQARELGCGDWNCFYGGLATGGGFAWRPGRPILLDAMIDAEADGGTPFRRRYRVGFGGSADAVINLGRFAQTGLSARYIRFLAGDDVSRPSFQAAQAVNLGPRAQARFVFESHGPYLDGRLELLGYF